jgi:ABC-type lipoprotein release transport system permease subunit
MRAYRLLLLLYPASFRGEYRAAAAVALLMTVSGSLVPALRAVRVDPATVLRSE